MLLYIDLEHADTERRHDHWRFMASHTLRAKYRIEDIADEECRIIRYDRMDHGTIQSLGPRAVFVGGHLTAVPDYPPESLASLMAWLAAPDRPTFGFCGAMQLAANAFGGNAGPMTAGKGGAVDPESVDGVQCDATGETGFLPITVAAPAHPLMRGLGETATVFQMHYWETKHLPDVFELLASSAQCRVQVIAHRTLPLMGTQFHPEAFDQDHPDGAIMIRNFLGMTA